MRTTLTAALALTALAACNLPVEQPAASPPPTSVPEAAAPTDRPTELPTPVPTPTGAPTVESAQPEGNALHIAYVLDGNVWGLEVGSAPVQLASSGHAVEVLISDDGQRLAYVELIPPDNLVALRSVQFDGGDDRLLLDQAAFDALYPLEGFLHYAPSHLAMLPGTHELLFNTRGLLEGPGLAKNDDLIRVNLDSGALSQLLPRGQGGDFTISPDATQLAIVRPNSIGFARSDGSQPRHAVLTFAGVITYSEYFFYPLPVWSGEAVLAAIPDPDPFFGPEHGSFWRVPADGSEPVLLSSPQADLFIPQRSAPIVSPDGARAVFFRKPDDTLPSQLWTYNLLEDEAQLYAEGPFTWLGWAPDSVHFSYQDESARELMLGQVGESPSSLGGARLLHWIGADQYLLLQEMTDGSWRLMLGSPGAALNELASFRGDFLGSAFAD